MKARKKTTRSTVRGISFGLILLIPLLFIVVAFHLDLNKEVNKDASIRVFNLSYVKEIPTSNNSIDSVKEEYADKVYEIKGIENIIKYNQYTFGNKVDKWDDVLQKQVYSSPFTIVIGDKSFALDYHLKDKTEVNQNEVGLAVIDKNIGNSVFIQADSQLSDGSPLVAGKEFSSDSIKEIMVSSNLLTHYNLTVEDVLNKEITITYELGYPSSASTSKTSIEETSLQPYNGVPLTILKNYEIIGIYDSKIYNSGTRLDAQKDYYQENSYYETYFWLTKDSLYSATDKSYQPELISIEVDNGEYTHTENGYYYSDNPINLSKNAISNLL